MSEPFPSTAYVKECIENQKELREEWEPRVGDFLRPKLLPADNHTFHQVYLHGTGLHHVAFLDERSMAADIECIAELKEHYIWVPQPRQLIEMLEERGYRGSMWFDIATELSSGETGPYSLQIFHKDRIAHYPLREGEAIFEILTVGPDPACALLRAWLEVVKEE